MLKLINENVRISVGCVLNEWLEKVNKVVVWRKADWNANAVSSLLISKMK